MREAGMRAGAISHSDQSEKIIYFYGYGTYEGSHVVEKGSEEPVGWIAEVLIQTGASNPRIRLDSGKAVWGCECWWGSEEEIQKVLKSYEDEGYSIVVIDPEDRREMFRQASHQESPGASD